MVEVIEHDTTSGKRVTRELFERAQLTVLHPARSGAPAQWPTSIIFTPRERPAGTVIPEEDLLDLGAVGDDDGDDYHDVIEAHMQRMVDKHGPGILMSHEDAGATTLITSPRYAPAARLAPPETSRTPNDGGHGDVTHEHVGNDVRLLNLPQEVGLWMTGHMLAAPDSAWSLTMWTRMANGMLTQDSLRKLTSMIMTDTWQAPKFGFYHAGWIARRDQDEKLRHRQIVDGPLPEPTVLDLSAQM